METIKKFFKSWAGAAVVGVIASRVPAVRSLTDGLIDSTLGKLPVVGGFLTGKK